MPEADAPRARGHTFSVTPEIRATSGIEFLLTAACGRWPRPDGGSALVETP